MVKRVWKVYGKEGHRQSESFNTSYSYDFSKNGETRIITVKNSDTTGTNSYSIIEITRDTAEQCYQELIGQLYDGVFENCNFGIVEEVM